MVITIKDHKTAILNASMWKIILIPIVIITREIDVRNKKVTFYYNVWDTFLYITRNYVIKNNIFVLILFM